MKEPAYKIEYLEAEAIRRILSTFQPEKIILFGSYIYGNPSYDSDLDILIEFKNIPNKRKLVIDIRKQFKDFPVAKDILVIAQDEIDAYKEKKWTIYSNALEKGKVVYEKK